MFGPVRRTTARLRATPRRRRRHDVDRILSLAVPAAGAATPFHILLVGEPKDGHPPGAHDYPRWLERWSRILASCDLVTVSVALTWPTEDQWSRADVAVFYSSNAGWTEEAVPQLDTFFARGGGVVFLHFAINGRNHVSQLADRLGMAWVAGASKFSHAWMDVQFHSHPLAAGFADLRFSDELYSGLMKGRADVDLMASAACDDGEHPLFWTRQQGRGRVFVSLLGHYDWTLDDPLFRILIFRGICWAGRQPIDRLSALAVQSARMS